MRRLFLGTTLALTLACAPAPVDEDLAQSGPPGEPADTAPDAGGVAASRDVPDDDAEAIALIGCLVPEDAYRDLVGDEAFGLAGLGGADDEYVLMNAIAVPDASDESSTPADMVEAYEALVAEGGGHVYVVDGDEENMATGANRLVEIAGTLEETVDAVEPGENATSVDALPVLQTEVWHPVGDFCPAG